MQYHKFKNHIIEIIQEQQYKLGFYEGDIKLYYPLASLLHLLEINDASDIRYHLTLFKEECKEDFGDIKISKLKDGRFCFTIATQGSLYVYQSHRSNPFLKNLIQLLQEANINMEHIFTLCQSYAGSDDNLHIEKVRHPDFDYLIYFKNGQPSAMYYCFKADHGHIIYHRFSKEDWEENF